jgi:hypothetical protein
VGVTFDFLTLDFLSVGYTFEMDPLAANWERPNFKPGGGDALVAFLIFGSVCQEFQLSTARYRSDGLPNHVRIVHHDRAKQPDVFQSLLTGHISYLLSTEQPVISEQVHRAAACIRVQGTVSDPRTLDYLREVVGVVTALLDQGGVAILDLLALRWWSPEVWQRDIFEPAAPVPRNHVTIMVSDEADSGRWFHTRGMRKFGRPDISVRNVPEDHQEGVIDLCNRLIEFMAFGAVLEEGEKVRMRSLPEGLSCRHAGSFDDPDFNNVHIEYTYPKSTCRRP